MVESPTWQAIWRARSVGDLSQLLRLESTLETLNFADNAIAFKFRQHLLFHRSLVLGLQRPKRRFVAGVVVAQPPQVGDQSILLLHDSLVVHPMTVAFFPQTYVRVLRLPVNAKIIDTTLLTLLA